MYYSTLPCKSQLRLRNYSIFIVTAAFFFVQSITCAFAMALLGDPKLLVPDEPINGLDVDGMRIMRKVLVDITKQYNCTVVISSHVLGELEKIATHYGIVRGGKMIKEMTAEELEAGCRTYVALQARDKSCAKALLSCKYSRVEEDESECIRVCDAASPEEIVTYLYENGILISEIKTAKSGLNNGSAHAALYRG